MSLSPHYCRSLWDDGALCVLRVPTPDAPHPSRHAESCMHKYVSRFPRPMAPREYDYARRVWHRPSDGGCYAISRQVELPADPSTPKAVKVVDFVSCSLIRAVPGGTEIASFYFEDSQVRPGLAKMAVPKGLWPFWTKYESSLRLFAETRRTTQSRRSMDGPDAAPYGGHPGATAAARLGDEAGDLSEAGSDDEVYGALAELKARKRGSKQRGLPGKMASGQRWTRRLIIAGALRMVQVMLADR